MENETKKDESKVEEIKSENKTPDMLDLANEVAQRLEQKKQELLQIEAQIDKKTADFKRFIESTSIQGKSMAGQAPKSDKELEDDKLKKVFESIGVKLPF